MGKFIVWSGRVAAYLLGYPIFEDALSENMKGR